MFVKVSFNFGGQIGVALRALPCVESAFNERLLQQVSSQLSTTQQKVKIQVLSDRRLSEDYFADKVLEERAMETMELGDPTVRINVNAPSKFESARSVYKNLGEGKEGSKDDRALAKKKLLEDLMIQRKAMAPFEVFSQIKDDPIPYEQAFLRSQSLAPALSKSPSRNYDSKVSLRPTLNKKKNLSLTIDPVSSI